jgi:hypothetical protein
VEINFKQYKFSPILGWSSSRYELFQKCKRHYFFNYYSKFVPETSFDYLKRLKSLTSVPLEVGNVVHHIIETFLRRLQKSDAPIDKERFVAYGVQLCEKLFSEKEFLEIYYGQVSEIDISEAKQKIWQILNNFMNSELYDWICTTAIKTRTNWVIEPSGYGETRINDLKAYCKMDFLFPIDDEIHILDWKSGKPHVGKHSKQLMGYALAAKYNNPEINSDKIIPRIVYMYPEIDELEFAISDNSLALFEQEVTVQTKEMYSFCSNVEQNIPRGFENFEKTNYTQLCEYCQFLEPCKNL